MRDLRIAIGERRTNPNIRNGKTTWSKLSAKLLRFTRTPETYAEYMAMPVDEQAAIKDVGYLVGGRFKEKVRRKADLQLRSIITLDIDHLKNVQELRDAYEGHEYVLHSTHKHNSGNPRLRLVFPIIKDIHPDKYEPLARAVADWLGMDYFDDTTFEVSRIMYWPSASSNGEVIAEHGRGEPIDPDDWLDDDWQDFGKWPHSSRVTAVRSSSGIQAEDPLSKPGIIGAFCRAYDIHSAIIEFDLPFEPTEWDNRYRLYGSSGASGAIVYDDIFLFSHHESHPESFNKNLNAFDLVRVCLFDDYTKQEIDDKVPPFETASMQEMLALASRDERVKRIQLEEELGPGDGEESDPGDTDRQRHQDGVNGERSKALSNIKVKKKKKTKQKKEVVRLTFKALAEEIAGLDDPTFDDCQLIIARVAAAKLDPVEVDVLGTALRDAYPGARPSKASVLRQIKTEGKKQVGQLSREGDIGDLEMDLLDEWADEHYADGAHIRRVGKRFWHYVHGVWQLVGDEPVRGKLQKTIVRLREERPEDMLELINVVGESKTSSLTGQLWSLLTSKIAETSEVGEDPLQLLRHVAKPVINCSNCELHFDWEGSYEVRDHDPSHFWTTQINADFDPDADCPEWDRFVAMIFSECGDPEDMIRHLEELGGYIIQMSRWLKNWVLFHGPTDTGKSTVLDVFSTLLGTSCLSAELARFSSGYTFAEASLIGKLLLADDDFAKAAQLPDGFIKKISEEKAITAEIKFGDSVAFQSRALPLICANHWPVTRDVSDAFRDRALVFGFDHRIKGKERSDRRKDRMLENELPGILNRFVAGLVRLRNRGAWDVPVDAVIAHDTWVDQSNQAILFIREVLTEEAKGWLGRPAIMPLYRHWHRDAGGLPIGRNELYERLEQLLGPVVVRNGERGWVGWSIRSGESELD